MGHPRPLFHLFLVFSNKDYNFAKNLMWKVSIQYPGAGIRTHDILITSLFP